MCVSVPSTFYLCCISNQYLLKGKFLNWLPFRKHLIDEDPLPRGGYPAEIHSAPEGEGLFHQIFAPVGKVLKIIPTAVGSLSVFFF